MQNTWKMILFFSLFSLWSVFLINYTSAMIIPRTLTINSPSDVVYNIADSCKTSFENYKKQKEREWYWEYEYYTMEFNEERLNKNCLDILIYRELRQRIIQEIQEQFDNQEYEKVINIAPKVVEKMKKFWEVEWKLEKIVYLEWISYEKIWELEKSLEILKWLVHNSDKSYFQDGLKNTISNIETKITQKNIEKQQKELEEKQKELEEKQEAMELKAEQERERIETEKKEKEEELQRQEEKKRQQEKLLRRSSMQEREIAKEKLWKKALLIEKVAEKLKQKNDPRIKPILKTFLKHKKEEVRSIGVYLLYLLEM